MGVTKERGFLIVYKHTHTHLGPWHSLIFLTPHNKILIWVSPSVFVLEKSIAFCGHFYLSISTVSKTETWKQIGIFQTSIRFYESNFAQSILFFFFSDCFMFPISQLMEKRLRNEIWHIPCGIKDTLKKYLNDYWHWNAKQLKFFLSGLGKKKLISCKFFSRFLLFCNFSIDLCLRIEEGSFIRC